MSLILYHAIGSPPSRAVLLTARSLGLDIEVKHVNLGARENHSDEFLKLNPQHQVPVLVDGDFVLTESKAIQAYLVNSRAPGSSLYPADPKSRALVDSRLYYDATVVFAKSSAAVRGLLFGASTTIPQAQKDQINESMKTLESFLDGREWIAGDSVTIADLSFLAGLATLVAIGYDLSKLPNMARWFEACKSLPGYEENQVGADFLANLVKNKLTEPF